MPTLKPSTTPEERVTVRALQNALKPFYKIRETMPLQYVTAFLLVAQEEHLNVTEYARRGGTSTSLMTRHLSDLGDVNRYHEPGFGLVEAYADLMDRRSRLMRLTAKGKHVVYEVCMALHHPKHADGEPLRKGNGHDTAAQPATKGA